MPDEENGAVVRAIIDAINRRDVDAAVGFASRDCEVDFSSSRSLENRVYRGRAGTRELFETFMEPWAWFRWEIEETIELPADRVLTVNRLRMQGHGSGVEVAAEGATIWTVRDGEIVAFMLYQTKAEAVEAAALDQPS